MRILSLMKQQLATHVNPEAVHSFRLPIDNNDVLAAEPAAVLVPIIQQTDGWSIILTERSAHLQHHPGQISFAGGRLHEEDRSFSDAALREAEEEIGLLPNFVSLAGSLHRHLIAQRFLVSPFVAFVEPFTIRRNLNEVERVFTLPVNFLLDDNNCLPDHRGADYQGHQFYFQQFHIWGGTASILLDLKQIILKNAKIYHYFSQH